MYKMQDKLAGSQYSAYPYGTKANSQHNLLNIKTHKVPLLVTTNVMRQKSQMSASQQYDQSSLNILLLR